MFTQNTNQANAQQVNSEAHQAASIEFYAQPYNPDARGFYFTTEEEFEQKSSECRDAFGYPVEEFEIQFIDGSHEEADLFSACGVNQANIGQFLTIIDEVPDFCPREGNRTQGTQPQKIPLGRAGSSGGGKAKPHPLGCGFTGGAASGRCRKRP